MIKKTLILAISIIVIIAFTSPVIAGHFELEPASDMGKYNLEKMTKERETARKLLMKLGATRQEAEKIVPKDEECASCHQRQAEQWYGSPKYQSFSFSRVATNLYIRDMQANGIKVDREVMRACWRCHAPTVYRDASDKVVQALIKIASEDREFAEMWDNDKLNTLKAIGVGCIECHTAQHTGKQEGPRYGTIKDAKAPHPTSYSPEMTRAEFCARCHSMDPKDADVYKKANRNHVGKSMLVYCALNYDDWKLSGTNLQCQQCHMQSYTGQAAMGGPSNRVVHNHEFGGSHNPDMLAKAATIAISGKRLSAGAGIIVDVISHVGHFIPAGCHFTAEVVLDVNIKDKNGNLLWKSQRKWYSTTPGILPGVEPLPPEMRWAKTDRSPAPWVIDEYIRQTTLKPGDNKTYFEFRIPPGTRTLTVEATLKMITDTGEKPHLMTKAHETVHLD